MAMWSYIKKYLHVAIPAALFMVGGVLADLLQPSMMKTIVDDGALGFNTGGMGDSHVILTMGAVMIVVAVLGGVLGSLNNIFTHMSSQNIGNDIRKDCFRRIMSFSFPQVDGFSTGSLVTRVTNDISKISICSMSLLNKPLRSMSSTPINSDQTDKTSSTQASRIVDRCRFIMIPSQKS